ncbi:hypothetical protein IM774_05160 [Erysipelotrichaceae bacterium RD49]|nr:hypothetical protein [Erysipelotrichaceae bacterium RD49]
MKTILKIENQLEKDIPCLNLSNPPAKFTVIFSKQASSCQVQSRQSGPNRQAFKNDSGRLLSLMLAGFGQVSLPEESGHQNHRAHDRGRTEKTKKPIRT